MTWIDFVQQHYKSLFFLAVLFVILFCDALSDIGRKW